MKRLNAKLHSRRGASILLALLLFLVCVMVGASVLAAAVSNAGKVQSSRVEQQKYLTLSSAIRLVADELARAEYTGRYQLWEWEVSTTVTDKSDPDNSVSTTTSSSYFYCKQIGWEADPTMSLPAAYSCGDLTAQLPLGKELDEIFSRQFKAKGGKTAGYEALEGVDVELSTERVLTVTLPDGLAGYPGDTGPEQYRVPKAVTVKVELDHATKHILLTAWLGEEEAPADGRDTMTAELMAKPDTVPVLSYAPGGRRKGDLPIPSSSSSTSGSRKTTTTVTVTTAGKVFPDIDAPIDPMQWELNWIKKGAAR